MVKAHACGDETIFASVKKSNRRSCKKMENGKTRLLLPKPPDYLNQKGAPWLENRKEGVLGEKFVLPAFVLLAKAVLPAKLI